MKKVIFIPVVLLVVFLQQPSSAQFMIGPLAGLNVATLNGADITITSKASLHAGMFVNIPLGKHFSILPAILYSLKGYQYSDTTNTTPNIPDSSVVVKETVNASLGYLDVPILLTYFTGEGKGFMIQAGPQFSYLISGNANGTTKVSINGGTAKNTTPTGDAIISFNKSDLALVGGLGYKFPKLLMVYARVATSFDKTQDGGFIKGADTGHNFVFEAGAALCFGPK